MDSRRVRSFRSPKALGAGVLMILLAVAWAGGTAGAQSPDRASPSVAAPTLISYQGIVELDGQPYDGTGYFKLAIVDAATGDGTANYWANDGTAAGEPSAGVPLVLSDGLVEVLLGDTSLPGMTQPLGAAALVATDTYLRVWFSASGDAGSYEAMEPNQRLSSVAYALRSESAAGADTVDGFHAAATPMAFHLIPLDANAYLRVPRLVDHNDIFYFVDPAGQSNLSEAVMQHVGINGLEASSGYYVEDAPANSIDYGLYVNDVDNIGVKIENSSTGIAVSDSASNGISVFRAGDDGLLVDDATDQGVRILSSGGEGLYVSSAGGAAGVYVDSPVGDGLFVNSPAGNGLQVSHAVEDAVYLANPQADGLEVSGAGDDGVAITDAGNDGVQITNPGQFGVYVDGSGGSALRVENAGGSGLYAATPVYHGVHVVSAGADGVRIEEAFDNGIEITNSGGNGVEVSTASSGLQVQNATWYGVNAEGDWAGAYFEDGDSGVYAYLAFGIYGISSNGTKSFVQPHPDDPSRAIIYAALEGGEAGTYYRGSAQLVDGTAVVELPEHFCLVTEEEGLTVQVTPRADCNGLYVAEVTTRHVVVKELRGGKSDARFDFLINGVRMGYQGFEVVRPMAEVNPGPHFQGEPQGLPEE